MSLLSELPERAFETYDGEFLRVIAGSTLSGISIGGGDIDLMGVCVEGPESVVGLDRFEQHTYRSQPEGVRSGPGDIDLTVYGLRKFIALTAMSGNPNMLLVYFAPKEMHVIDTPWAEQLRQLLPHILTARVAHTFIGYAQAQRERMLGIRGGRRVKRVVNEEVGFDTKYGCHMIRLGFQGCELLRTGNITLPMPESERELCKAIRHGRITQNAVLATAETLERDMIKLRDASGLPATPDMARINAFLFKMYQQRWTEAA